MRKAFFTVGDTAPALSGTCTNNGVGTSLVGATLTVEVRKPSGKRFSASATATDPVNGVWEYLWRNEDIDEAGEWTVKVHVTFSDTTRQTFGPATFSVQE